ncbi:hypothetical protein RND81_10G005500 [Saponaria officinalis]|uniref:Uncharacterized protein n=1 Tax=Saponaria officinalis TaxID=3572 RepID=A0AAW1HYR5_SAPOF
MMFLCLHPSQINDQEKLCQKLEQIRERVKKNDGISSLKCQNSFISDVFINARRSWRSKKKTSKKNDNCQKGSYDDKSTLDEGEEEWCRRVENDFAPYVGHEVN